MSGSVDLSARLFKRQPLSSMESTLLSGLAAEGNDIFTITDVVERLNKPYAYAKVIVNRLVKKRWAIRLTGGKYLIVPLAAGVRAEYSEHEYIIASRLVEPDYIAYWSALSYHGLTEQVPSIVFVATTSRASSRKVLDTSYSFVTLKKNKFFGYRPEPIGSAQVNVSDPEKTIIDCLDHPEYCGGLEEVVKALRSRQNSLSFDKILTYAMEIGNSAILKRFGFLSESIGIKSSDEFMNTVRKEIKRGYSLLDPTEEPGGHYSARWRLRVNVSERRLSEWRETE